MKYTKAEFRQLITDRTSTNPDAIQDIACEFICFAFAKTSNLDDTLKQNFEFKKFHYTQEELDRIMNITGNGSAGIDDPVANVNKDKRVGIDISKFQQVKNVFARYKPKVETMQIYDFINSYDELEEPVEKWVVRYRIKLEFLNHSSEDVRQFEKYQRNKHYNNRRVNTVFTQFSNLKGCIQRLDKKSNVSLMFDLLIKKHINTSEFIAILRCINELGNIQKK